MGVGIHAPLRPGLAYSLDMLRLQASEASATMGTNCVHRITAGPDPADNEYEVIDGEVSRPSSGSSRKEKISADPELQVSASLTTKHRCQIASTHSVPSAPSFTRVEKILLAAIFQPIINKGGLQYWTQLACATVADEKEATKTPSLDTGSTLAANHRNKCTVESLFPPAQVCTRIFNAPNTHMFASMKSADVKTYVRIVRAKDQHSLS